MVLLLALGAAAAAAPRVATAAQATVRVLRPVSASERDWKEARSGHKREILVKEADGRTTRLRLTEHEYHRAPSRARADGAACRSEETSLQLSRTSLRWNGAPVSSACPAPARQARGRSRSTLAARRLRGRDALRYGPERPRDREA